MTQKDRIRTHRHNEANDMITGPYDAKDEPFDYEVQPGEFARFPVGDGHISLVEQRYENYGFATVGCKARETLNELISVYRFSSLEIYEVLGGSRENAPNQLINAHYAHYNGLCAAMKSRQLPSLDDIVGVPDPQLSVLGQSEIGLIAGSACIEGNIPLKDYFHFWFYTDSGIKGLDVSLANLGANGITGDGQWFDGDANLWLGPTTAGAAIVCFPSPNWFGDYDLKVEEKIAPGLWTQLWSGPSSYAGYAMGIYFTGIVVRNVRILIRVSRDEDGNPDQHGEIDPFFWGGSY